MKQQPELTSDQKHILDTNLRSSMESGLATRYLTSQRNHAQRLARIAGIPDEPAAEILHEAADEISVAIGAETPFLFVARPSNMAQELVMVKSYPQTGETVPGSDVQIGLVGGLAGEGRPVDVFSQEDVILAKQALAAQDAVGLRTS